MGSKKYYIKKKNSVPATEIYFIMYCRWIAREHILTALVLHPRLIQNRRLSVYLFSVFIKLPAVNSCTGSIFFLAQVFYLFIIFYLFYLYSICNRLRTAHMLYTYICIWYYCLLTYGRNFTSVLNYRTSVFLLRKKKFLIIIIFEILRNDNFFY